MPFHYDQKSSCICASYFSDVLNVRMITLWYSKIARAYEFFGFLSRIDQTHCTITVKPNLCSRNRDEELKGKKFGCSHKIFI